MSSEGLIQRRVETASGVLTLHAPAEAFGSVRPLALAVTGFFGPLDDLAGLPSALDIYGDGCVVRLHEMELRAGWSVQAIAALIEAAISAAFPGRPIVLCGVSLGATVCLAVRSPQVRRIVAIEPVLTNQGLWPVTPRIQERLRQAGTAAFEHERWLGLLGIGPDTVEPRDYLALARAATAPIEVLLGEEPLSPERPIAAFPSLVDEPVRRALSRLPRVRLRIAPGCGHNVQFKAPKLVIESVQEACRRAAARRPFDVGRLDEPLFEATPITARRVVHWGPEAETFRDALAARQPQAHVQLLAPGDEPPKGKADIAVLAATPPPQVLKTLAGRLAPDGCAVMRWTAEAEPLESLAWLAEAGFAAPEVLEPGIVRLRSSGAAAPRPLRIAVAALAPTLMDIRVRLPGQMLNSLPDLTVADQPAAQDLPALARDAPKILLVQRPARPDHAAWLRTLRTCLANGWLVVIEYDDHPAVVDEVRGLKADKPDLSRFRYAHAVQTSTPPLVEVFRAENPEVALFPNAVFELLPFPRGKRPQRVFYGGVLRGDFAVEVAHAMAPVVEEFPDLEFVVVGDPAVFEALPTAKKVLHPFMSYEGYLAAMSGCAISLSPMEPKPLRETKSDAKYLDAARAGVLTIASPTTYERVIEPGVNGLLARELADWPRLLAQALRDPEGQRRMAKAAWEQVRRERMFAHQAKLRADWYRDLWARRDELTRALVARVPELADAAPLPKPSRAAAATNLPAPKVPISWGELVDKITILEIKAARLTAEPALANVRRELAALRALEPDPKAHPPLARLKAALAEANGALWDVEDAIRLKEAAGDFGREFVELARAVYRRNDERAALKREINLALGSELMEEKSYRG